MLFQIDSMLADLLLFPWARFVTNCNTESHVTLIGATLWHKF